MEKCGVFKENGKLDDRHDWAELGHGRSGSALFYRLLAAQKPYIEILTSERPLVGRYCARTRFCALRFQTLR